MHFSRSPFNIRVLKFVRGSSPNFSPTAERNCGHLIPQWPALHHNIISVDLTDCTRDIDYHSHCTAQPQQPIAIMMEGTDDSDESQSVQQTSANRECLCFISFCTVLCWRLGWLGFRDPGECIRPSKDSIYSHILSNIASYRLSETHGSVLA